MKLLLEMCLSFERLMLKVTHPGHSSLLPLKHHVGLGLFSRHQYPSKEGACLFSPST